MRLGIAAYELNVKQHGPERNIYLNLHCIPIHSHLPHFSGNNHQVNCHHHHDNKHHHLPERDISGENSELSDNGEKDEMSNSTVNPDRGNGSNSINDEESDEEIVSVDRLIHVDGLSVSNCNSDWEPAGENNIDYEQDIDEAEENNEGVVEEIETESITDLSNNEDIIDLNNNGEAAIPDDNEEDEVEVLECPKQLRGTIGSW